MSLPRGTTIPLSPSRKMVGDLLHAARQVPLVAVERDFRLGEMLGVWKGLAARPSWFAMFIKAYAIVSDQQPELRRAFLSFPWARLHQHNCNVVHLPIARWVGDEEAVLSLLIRHPERLSLAELDAKIRAARTGPVEQFGDFRRILRLGRLPTLLRRFLWWMGLNVSGKYRARFFGTSLITSVGALGVSSLHVLSPLTTSIAYGAFKDDGSLPVRLFYDHRVLDGVQPARALVELEKTLTGPILAELRGGMSRAA